MKKNLMTLVAAFIGANALVVLFFVLFSHG